MANEADTETELAIRMAADEAYNKGRLEGQTTGLNAAYARLSAIMADDRVKGREIFAIKLAVKSPSMNCDDIGSMCADLPAASSAPSLADKVDATGVNAIRPGAAPQQTSADSWSKAVNKVNARNAGARAA